eukprot:scaffold207_cov267-Pinguiococcus_pyrenoidosus.AAC.28
MDLAMRRFRQSGLIKALRYLKLREGGVALLVHHERHLRSEHEGRTLPSNAQLALEVSQEVPEVNVEEVTPAGDHDVVRVTISDAHDVRRDAVACTAVHEVLDGALPLDVRRVVIPEIVVDHLVVKGSEGAAVRTLDVGRRGRLGDHFDPSQVLTSRAALVGPQMEIDALCQPLLVHDPQHVQRHVVLPKVIAALVDRQEALAFGVRVLEVEPQGQLLGRHDLALAHHQAPALHPWRERRLEARRESGVQLGELLAREGQHLGLRLPLDLLGNGADHVVDRVLLPEVVGVRPAVLEVHGEEATVLDGVVGLVHLAPHEPEEEVADSVRGA